MGRIGCKVIQLFWIPTSGKACRIAAALFERCGYCEYPPPDFPAAEKPPYGQKPDVLDLKPEASGGANRTFSSNHLTESRGKATFPRNHSVPFQNLGPFRFRGYQNQSLLKVTPGMEIKVRVSLGLSLNRKVYRVGLFSFPPVGSPGLAPSSSDYIHWKAQFFRAVIMKSLRNKKPPVLRPGAFWWSLGESNS
jgi:hypothetical protein